MSEELAEAQYKSVNHALGCAFNNRAPYQSPSITPPTGGGGDGSTWDERAGDAGNIKAEVRRTLSGVFFHVINAQYIDYQTNSAKERQQLDSAIEFIRARIGAEKAEVKSRYILHLIRLWAGVPDLVTCKGDAKQADEEFWCDEFGVTTRTLRNWRNGRMTQGFNKCFGVNELLDKWRNTAIGILKPVFRQNEWVE